MIPDDQIVRIFKTPDLNTIVEVAVIFIGAGVVIHLLQHLLRTSRIRYTDLCPFHRNSCRSICQVNLKRSLIHLIFHSILIHT